MKKKKAQHIPSDVKRIGLLLLCGVIGFLLIILSNLLPVERIRNHIRNGAEILLQNSAEYQYADGYVSAVLDNSTDDLILAKVVYESTDPIQDAVMVPNYSYPGEDAGGLILFETLNRESTEDANIDFYPVYWHGYLVILRPLFTILTYADFRILNQILELILFAAVLYLMQKRSLGRFIPAFVVMIAFWNPGTMGVSLQYAPCYYLSMIGSAIVLLRENGMAESGVARAELASLTFFMLLGVLTSYLDFLTYPIATFGVPMIFVILQCSKGSGLDDLGIAQRLHGLIRCGLWWMIGYVGMWAEKWIYGSLLCRTSLLGLAFGKISERASAEESGEQISRLGTVGYLLQYAFFKKPYIILIMLFLVFLVVIAAWRRKRCGDCHCVAPAAAIEKTAAEKEFERNPKKSREKNPKKEINLELLCIAGLPLIWYFTAANHSHMHPRLVYRSMGVLLFAVGSLMTQVMMHLDE